MSLLKFRNIEVSPSAPVEEWGFEGVLAAVERGDLDDWARLAAAFRSDPFGEVAQELDEALGVADAPGAVALLSRALADARAAH